MGMLRRSSLRITMRLQYFCSCCQLQAQIVARGAPSAATHEQFSAQGGCVATDGLSRPF